MKKSLSTDDLFDRRIQHQKKISEAIDNHDEKRLSILESQWVHRYGFDSLPITHQNFVQSDKSLSEEPLKFKENIDKEYSLKEEEIPMPKASNVDDEKLNNVVVSQEGKKSVSDYSASSKTNTTAPPSPSIRHLRRWMPLTKDKLPKAS